MVPLPCVRIIRPLGCAIVPQHPIHCLRFRRWPFALALLPSPKFVLHTLPFRGASPFIFIPLFLLPLPFTCVPYVVFPMPLIVFFFLVRREELVPIGRGEGNRLRGTSNRPRVFVRLRKDLEIISIVRKKKSKRELPALERS